MQDQRGAAERKRARERDRICKEFVDRGWAICGPDSCPVRRAPLSSPCPLPRFSVRGREGRGEERDNGGVELSLAEEVLGHRRGFYREPVEETLNLSRKTGERERGIV